MGNTADGDPWTAVVVHSLCIGPIIILCAHLWFMSLWLAYGCMYGKQTAVPGCMFAEWAIGVRATADWDVFSGWHSSIYMRQEGMAT